LEEIAVCAGHKVLMQDDDNSLLIVGNPQGISSQQFRPHQNALIEYHYYIDNLFNYI
jgi:hypothetical protein